MKHWLSRQSALARGCDRVVRGSAAIGIAVAERLASWRPLPDLDAVKPSIRDVVVTSFFGIGDGLMDQPAMAALRRALPDARIRLVCSHSHADLFAGQGLADQIIAVDESRFLEAARGLRLDRPDLFVMFHSNLEYYLFGRLCGARLRAGYLWDFRAARASGFRAGPRTNRSRSRVARGLEVSALLGADVESHAQPRWRPSEADRAAAAALLSCAGVGAGTRFVVVNPNKTASWLGAGRWPRHRWRRTIARVRRDYDVTVVLVGSPAERVDVVPIAAAFHDDPRVVSLAGETSLRETAAVLARAELVITTDSGIMHLAGAVGVRAISLFTFSDPASFATGERNHVLEAHVPCSPCVRNHMSARDHHPPLCPYDFRCGRAIPADAVADAISAVLPAPTAADVAS